MKCLPCSISTNTGIAQGNHRTVEIMLLGTSWFQHVPHCQFNAVSRSLTGHRSNCLTLEFHPFGPFLATGSLDTNVKVWDLRRKDAITTFKGHTKGVKKVAISPDGKWVCSGSENGEVKVRQGRLLASGCRGCCCRHDVHSQHVCSSFQDP